MEIRGLALCTSGWSILHTHAAHSTNITELTPWFQRVWCVYCSAPSYIRYCSSGFELIRFFWMDREAKFGSDKTLCCTCLPYMARFLVYIFRTHVSLVKQQQGQQGIPLRAPTASHVITEDSNIMEGTSCTTLVNMQDRKKIPKYSQNTIDQTCWTAGQLWKAVVDVGLAFTPHWKNWKSVISENFHWLPQGFIRIWTVPG